jgi:ABC-type lipoprotein release transport system permease subunit
LRLQRDSASGYRFAAIATLSAAAAGITLLSGLLQLRFLDAAASALIAANPIPDPTWPHVWLGAAQTPRALQAEAINEWLLTVVALLFTIMLLAGISALIALFAHASARRYEIALSAVVGASRKQLTALHLRKAAVNAGAALAIGASIGLAGAYIANRTWPHEAAPVHAGAWLLISMLFCCALAAFVAIRAAARMAHPGWMGDVLAPEARTNPGFGAEDLRGVLLQLQFAFTFALLVAALLVWQHARTAPAASATRLRSDMHITQYAVPVHATKQQRRALQEELLRELAAAGETSHAIASPGTLVGVGTSDQIMSNCGQCAFSNMWLPLFPLRTQQHVVGAGFFETVGLHVQLGREFEAKDADARHVVVNDTFASLAFQGQHAIGKQIQVGGLRGQWYTVVGVIRDIPITGLLTFTPDDKSIVKSNIPGKEPAIYFYAGEKPPAVFDVITKRPVQLHIAGIAPRASTTIRDLLGDARAPARWFGGVLGALALSAALIAMLSLGAITLLNVRQRELEIAARRAVGARRRDILHLILSNSITTAARGTFYGVILSLAVARALQMVLPEMKVADLEITIVTAVALGVVALLSSLIPARAAASVPPAQIHA